VPAAPFDVRRRNLIVVPRPLPAAPLAVRRTYLIVVLRPLRDGREAAASREEQLVDDQRSRANITSLMCTEPR
jgi:hypothetical protein